MALAAAVALAAAWPGVASASTAWTFEATPLPAGGTQGTLSAVSCRFASNCTAAGDYITGSGTHETLAEHWNGSTWAVEPTPDPAGATGSYLTGVSCGSATTCMAVGYYLDSSGNRQPLAEHWDGTAWAIQTTPLPLGSAAGELSAVSCVAATSCVATGGYQAPNYSDPLAEVWRGLAWSVHDPVGSGLLDSSLAAVSCASAGNCMAVGTSLAEHWDGTTWQAEAVPSPVAGATPVLGAVSCPLASSCTATGGYSTGVGDTVAPLAEHWDGSAWAIQSAASSATAYYSYLGGVSCSVTGRCTAVGTQELTGTPNERRALAEVWNGSAWSLQGTAAPTGHIELDAVSCAAGACAATGAHATPQGVRLNFQPLAEER
jgi:hypothetical protein